MVSVGSASSSDIGSEAKRRAPELRTIRRALEVSSCLSVASRCCLTSSALHGLMLFVVSRGQDSIQLS